METLVNSKGVKPGAPLLSSKYNYLRWSIVGLLFIAMVISYIDRGNMSMVAPLLDKSFGLDATRKGFIFSAFFLGYSLMQIPAGMLVDKYGYLASYALFYLVWGLTATCFGFASTFLHFIILRFLLGFCESISGPASFAFITKHFSSNERGLASGIFLSGTKVGPAVGAVLAAYLIDVYGWRTLFVLTGLVPLIWLFPWVWLNKKINKEPQQALEISEASGLETATKEQSIKIPFNQLIKQRPIIGIFLGYLCYGYVWYLFITWLPSYLYEQLKFSISETGWWSAFSYTGLALVTIFAGWLADLMIKKGKSESGVRIGFVAIGFLLGGSILFIPLLDDKNAIAILLVMAISGVGLATANTWAITQTIAPKGTVGTLTGIQNFGATSGGLIAPVATGYMVQSTQSFNIPFMIAGALMLLGILCYTVLIKKVEPLKISN